MSYNPGYQLWRSGYRILLNWFEALIPQSDTKEATVIPKRPVCLGGLTARCKMATTGHLGFFVALHHWKSGRRIFTLLASGRSLPQQLIIARPTSIWPFTWVALAKILLRGFQQWSATRWRDGQLISVNAGKGGQLIKRYEGAQSYERAFDPAWSLLAQEDVQLP